MKNKTPQIDNYGWVSIHRKIINNPIFDNPNGLKVWIWCLLKANRIEDNVLLGRELIHLKSGQFIFGSITACEQLKMSKSTIHFWMRYLTTQLYIERQTTNRYSIVTILNYIEYQTIERQVERQRNANETPNETNNKYNMYNKENNNTTPNILKINSDVKTQPKQNITTPQNNRLLEIQKGQRLPKCRNCGNCSKCSLTSCTDIQIWEIAMHLNIAPTDVKSKHQAIMELIESGTFQTKYKKDKTVYYTLQNWLRMGIDRGQIPKLDETQRLYWQAQHPDKLKELKKIEDYLRKEGKL